MGTGKLLGKPNKLRGNDRRWTSILSMGSRNTPRRFMLQKPGISSSSYGPLGLKGFIYHRSVVEFLAQENQMLFFPLWLKLDSNSRFA